MIIRTFAFFIFHLSTLIFTMTAMCIANLVVEHNQIRDEYEKDDDALSEV
jgi:hypothetical protein